MKKLSLLVALALLITVGGVYATWDYAEKASEAKSMDMPGAIQMTDYTNASAKGIIEVDVTHCLVSIHDANNDHEPEIVAEAEDYITIQFTPDAKASQDIFDDAISLNYWFTLSADKKYDYDGNGAASEDIFTIKTNESNKGLISAGSWTRNGSEGNVTFTFTIPASEIFGTTADADIQFNDNVTLDTIAEYQAFDAAVNNGFFVLHLAEPTA